MGKKELDNSALCWSVITLLDFILNQQRRENGDLQTRSRGVQPVIQKVVKGVK